MTALELADALEAEPDCTCHAACYMECCCDAIWPEQYMLTAAAELRRLHAEIDTAVAMEREACAQLAEEPYEFTSTEASSIADAIRARSNT